MRSIFFWQSIAVLFILPLSSLSFAQEAQSWSQLAQHFRELPMEARRLTGPLFWLHGDETPAKLEEYVARIAEGGNGCFTAESRPHNDWLGEGWYRDLQICLDAAKRHDLKMWIFDERWWPSQMVGGNVPAEYGTKLLESEHELVNGPTRYEMEDVDESHLVTLLAGKADESGKIDDTTLIDLRSHVVDGRLTWDVPQGRWSVMTIRWRLAGAVGHQQKWISVDGASPDCVEWFLQTVYQPHYDRFSDEFGKTIAGFFYDEPETQGNWGTEVIPELQRRGVDWKAALVAKQFQLQDPQRQVAAAYQYQDAFAEVWGRTMYGGISDWCRKHDVVSIGHFMEHDRLYLNPTYCAGNMFQLQKYSDMGAIDLVVHQMYPGTRPVDIYQTPKLASSISHAYGKADHLAMCEIYGGYDQKLTYPQMKWLVDQHQVRGVNFMIPHSFNPRSPYDRDYPPYFYNNGYEPRWPLYRVWSDYTNRLAAVLTGGRHVCPVALLYLGNSYHAGKSILPEDMTTSLQDALLDCDWIPYDAFQDTTEMADRELQLHDERYRVLILPAVEVIPYEVLEKAKRFYEAGGIVVAYGILPSRSATLGKDHTDIAAVCRSIFGDPSGPSLSVCQTNAAEGRSYYLPAQPTAGELQQVLIHDAGVRPTLEVIAGETDGWLHVLHRVKADRDVFFVTNQQHQGALKTFRFRANVSGMPEVWDAMRGTIHGIGCEKTSEDGVKFELSLHPLESVVLVFSAEKRPLGARIGLNELAVYEPLLVERKETPPELLVPTQPAGDNVSSEPGDQRISPVVAPAASDPFVGEVDIPESWLKPGLRVCLEADAIAPEAATAVRVNDRYAGGFIGEPFRLEITSYLQPGKNQIVMQPFAPQEVRVVAYRIE
jgi:hypothetical protein